MPNQNLAYPSTVTGTQDPITTVSPDTEDREDGGMDFFLFSSFCAGKVNCLDEPKAGILINVWSY